MFGHGSAAVLIDTDGPIAGCFDNKDLVSIDQNIREFVSHFSSFLAPTRTVPRDEAVKDHIEFVVTCTQSEPTKHGQEVIDALTGAY